MLLTRVRYLGGRTNFPLLPTARPAKSELLGVPNNKTEAVPVDVVNSTSFDFVAENTINT